MRRVFFAIFCLCWIFNNVAFAAMCNAGYYNDNGSCVKCSGSRYCPGDDIAHDCPSVEEHKRTTFPDYDVVQAGLCTSIPSDADATQITNCIIYCFITDRRGFLLDYANYNITTQKYDYTKQTLWYAVKPGYYLSRKSACGAYAYYKKINECPAGSYCPGKSSVICNSSNQSVVHTTTFGLETCPEGYWSNDGASECTGNTIQINWDNTEQSDIAANEAGTVTYGGDIRTPRKAVHKPGKIFTGWTFVNPLAVLMENVNTDGTSSTGSGTSWSATFNYGTITGTSLCSSTAGTTTGETGTPDESGTGDTKQCWCRMDNFTPTNGDTISAQSLWMFGSSYSSADACLTYCAAYCGSRAHYSSALRGVLYGSIQ